MTIAVAVGNGRTTKPLVHRVCSIVVGRRYQCCCSNSEEEGEDVCSRKFHFSVCFVCGGCLFVRATRVYETPKKPEARAGLKIFCNTASSSGVLVPLSSAAPTSGVDNKSRLVWFQAMVHEEER